jgi:hypothetical protein
MMRQLGPIVLSLGVYVAFKHFYCHQRVDKKLFWEAAIFSLITAVVMRIYLVSMGYIEGMSTFGPTCPKGYKMVDDPVNSEQQTCVADGKFSDVVRNGH